MNLNINIIKKKFTKELSASIKYASYISISSLIGPKELIISLILNSKLLQTIIGLRKDQFNSLKSLVHYTNIHKIEPINKDFSKEISFILYMLSSSELPFNSVSLFTYIYQFNYEYVKSILAYLGLDEHKIYVRLQEDIFNFLRPEFKIPHTLEHYLNIIKLNYRNIVGREIEIKNLIEILKRISNKNPILIGPSGSGKSLIIKKLIYNMPSRAFISLDLITFLKNVEKNKTLLFKLVLFLQNNPKIILICNNIELLFDSSKTDLMYLSSFLIESLKLKKINIIGTLTSFKKYEDLLKNYDNLNYIFSTVELNEFSKQNIIDILIYRSIKLNKIYNIKISKQNIEYIYNLTNIYIKNLNSPIKYLLVLDSVFTTLKSNKYMFLVKEVSKKDIINAIKQYSNISSTTLDTTSGKEQSLDKIHIEDILNKRVYGQDHVVKSISSSVKRAFSGMKDKNKPIGSWLLCGPSGTGKTEMVKSLASTLFGSDSDLIRFDMSEFKEAHSSSKLIGCPPGYVGHDQGGVLTKAVKNKPYAVILFDEIEKAHKSINDLMLQLLDEGRLTDSFGEVFDFTNTIIIFTSNLGCPKTIEDFKSISAQKGNEMNNEEFIEFKDTILSAVKKHFKPEFLNRLTDTLIYKPLTKNSLLPIADKYIKQIEFKLKEHQIPLYLNISLDIKKLLIKMSYNPLYGARPLKRSIEEHIEQVVSEIISIHKFNITYKLSMSAVKDTHNKITNISYVYSPVHSNI